MRAPASGALRACTGLALLVLGTALAIDAEPADGKPPSFSAPTAAPTPVMDAWTPARLYSAAEYREESSFRDAARALPEGVSPAALYGWISGGRNCIVDPTTGGGYRVFVDLDADGDLAEETAVSMSHEGDVFHAEVQAPDSVAPLVFSFAPDGPGPRSLLQHDSTRRSGVLGLGGRSVPFALEGSGGRYDRDDDAVVLDLDGDGSLDFGRRSDERFPISERTVTLGDATYQMVVDPGGDHLTLVQTAFRPARPSLSPGSVAPHFAAYDLDGTLRRLSDYRGRVVLLSFWATWCGPCLAEMPMLRAAYGRFHDAGFEILGITDGDAPGAVARHVSENGIAWPQVIEERDGRLLRLYRVSGVPSLFLVDQEGVIASNDVPPAQLGAAIEELLRRGSSQQE